MTPTGVLPLMLWGLDARVDGERRALPEGDHGGARLEEDDVIWRGSRPPAERLIEMPRSIEIRHTKGHEREALVHLLNLAMARASGRKRCA